MPASKDSFLTSARGRALKLVSNFTFRIGLPEIYTAFDEAIKSSHAIIFFCKFGSSAVNEDPVHLPVAVLTSDDVLRFLIPNDQGISEIHDLKNVLVEQEQAQNIEKHRPSVLEFLQSNDDFGN